MSFSRFSWLMWVIAFLLQSGQIEDAFGIPSGLPMGGSNLCTQPGPRNYEVIFKDKTSLVANASYCNLDVWTDAKGMLLCGENIRSFPRIKARLKTDNLEFVKIYIDREHQARFNHQRHVNLIMQIACPNRKFKCCIRFHEGKEPSPQQRRLLGVSNDHPYLHRDPIEGQPSQAVILLIVGAVILVIAGSLCTNCNKGQELETRPQILSYHERLPSQYQSVSEEQKVQQEIVFEAKDDVVVEIAERIEGDSVNINNHLGIYDEPMVSVRQVQPQSIEEKTSEGTNHLLSNEQHVQISTQHVSGSEQHLPSSAQNVSSVSQGKVPSVQHEQSSAQHVSSKRVSTTDGEKKKRDSKQERDHEEHKGKFWKRTRSSRKNSSNCDDHRTSDVIVKDEEHKHHDRRLKRDSKEQKGKSKDRKGSPKSEEKKSPDENRSERPRAETPTLERHSRGLPAPPPPSSSFPDRRLPQRQFSAPDSTELKEDDNYEVVEKRKTRSVENIDTTADDNYDTVRVEVGKPQHPRLVSESITVDRPASWRGSDIYEVVEETSQAEDLYDEVEDTQKNNNEKDEDENPEDPYWKIKKLNERKALENLEVYEEVEEDENPEDPYWKIKKLNERKALENLELYEEVDKKQENAVENKDSLDVLKDKESVRNRSKSDTAGLQRPGNDFVRRCHTIDVVRERQGAVASTEGKVTNASLDYLYAKVDLSKKQRKVTEGDSGTSMEIWSDDNPPPLPPVYVSSRQIQDEMGVTEGAKEEDLYDEVGTSSSEPAALPDVGLTVPGNDADDVKRLSSASDHYELVEVKHDVATVDDNYTGIVDEGPRPKSGGNSRARAVHVGSSSIHAGISTVVSNSKGTAQGEDEDEDGVPHYEIVTPRSTGKKVKTMTDVDWV